MFYSAKYKVDRANRQLLVLIQIMKEFVELTAYRDKPVTMSIPQLSPDVPFIIGELAHNLRTSLDHVWNDLTMRATQQQSADYFLIRKEKSELEKKLDNSELIRVHYPRLRNIILNDIEPVQGGKGDLIWKINELDKADKHRSLIVSVVKTVLTLPATDATTKSYASGKADSDLSFGQNEVFSNEPVIPTLKSAIGCILNAINVIEKELG